MKKINMQKIILVLIPVLFIFSGVSKADTFTYIDNATQAMGGAGFDNCNMCQYTFLLQTDKPIYTENANGGGETVYVISSAYQGPPSTQIVQSGNYSIQQNNSGQFTTMLTSGNNDPGYSFEVGTDSNGSPSYWDVNRAYRVVENFGGFDTSGGSFIVNYNGQYDPGASYDLVSSPMVWFTLQSGASTSTSTNCTTTTSTSSVVSTSTVPGSGGSSDGGTEYYNDNLGRVANISYTDGSGNYHDREDLGEGQSVCALSGTMGGQDGGWLRILGTCAIQGTGTTTATTTNIATTTTSSCSKPPSIFVK